MRPFRSFEEADEAKAYLEWHKEHFGTHNFGELLMPSKTPKQARTMAAAAHNPAFAKRVGIPQKVAKEFNQADAAKRRGKKK